MRPYLLVPALALCCVGGLAGTPTARGLAGRATAGCTRATGVLVVVDFGVLGGGTVTRCLRNQPGSGYQALRAAGFRTAGTQHDGAGFVCRINNRPAPEREPCVDTPPPTASWSYWRGRPGENRWAYSQLGALDSEPQVGQVEGWSFGSGRPPGASPAALLPAAAPAATPPPAPSRRPDPAPATAGPRATRSASASILPSPQVTTPVAGAPEAAPAGIPWSALLAFALVWLVGIAAGVLVRRRRRGGVDG